MKPILFDSHAHLDDRRFDKDRDNVIEKAKSSGVGRIINVGADLASSSSTVSLSQKHDFIYAAVGVHPHSADEYDDCTEKELRRLAKNQKVVAIGEIGLDYHYDNSPRNIQKETFIKQLGLALELGLPVIIHNREAHRDCLDILNKVKGNGQKGVFHCYSGSAEMVREVLDLDFYISFAGVITFKNAKKAVEALKKTPIERLLFETDCPYLSPEPKRGKRNMPAYVEYTARRIAGIIGMDYRDLCKQVWDNTHRLFSRLP